MIKLSKEIDDGPSLLTKIGILFINIVAHPAGFLTILVCIVAALIWFASRPDKAAVALAEYIDSAPTNWVEVSDRTTTRYVDIHRKIVVTNKRECPENESCYPQVFVINNGEAVRIEWKYKSDDHVFNTLKRHMSPIIAKRDVHKRVSESFIRELEGK